LVTAWQLLLILLLLLVVWLVVGLMHHLVSSHHLLLLLCVLHRIRQLKHLSRKRLLLLHLSSIQCEHGFNLSREQL